MPGEDPFLSGEYANFYVTGCQQGPDPRYLKMSSGLKHYTAYSLENDRGGSGLHATVGVDTSDIGCG